MMIKDVAKFMRSVSVTNGRTEKTNLLSSLSKQKYGDLCKSVIEFTYNPYIVTNISLKKMGKATTSQAEFMIKDLTEYIEYLSNSRGNNVNIATIQAFIEQYSDDEDIVWLLEGMACKNLKVGATPKTFNKAFGKGFIPVFEIMLAEKWVDYDKKKDIYKENWLELEGKEVISTLKIDGNRCEAIVDFDGKVSLFSREGNPMEGYTEIEQELSKAERGFVYEGEVLALGDFENANQRFKKTSSIARSKGEKTGIELVVFDIIPIGQFTNQRVNESNTTVMRKNDAKNFVGKLNSPLVRYLPPMYVGMFDKELLDKQADEMKKLGEEGIMVQLANAPYEFKRTRGILKYKSFESADIKVIDVYEGITGKNIGRLGGIICDYKGSRVKVGIGIDEWQRDDYWADPSLIIGKIVEVKYFEEFISDDGEYDLRFASLKTIREDKAEESYY